MKAKETVMTLDQMGDEVWAMGCKAEDEGIRITQRLRFEAIAQAQAEISFPLGEVEGRRQIVRWVEREFGVDWSGETEQLRKWGIE